MSSQVHLIFTTWCLCNNIHVSTLFRFQTHVRSNWCAWQHHKFHHFHYFYMDLIIASNWLHEPTYFKLTGKTYIIMGLMLSKRVIWFDNKWKNGLVWTIGLKSMLMMFVCCLKELIIIRKWFNLPKNFEV